MRMGFKTLFAAALVLAALATPAASQSSAPASRVTTAAQVTTQLPRNVRPIHYDIALAPDAEGMTFTGKAVISIEVLQPTHVITLNALDLSFAQVQLSGDGGAGFGPVKHSVDPAAQTATFTLGKAVPPGTYRLAIDYTGKIGTQAVGLFAIDYDTPAGRRRALFTQFEASDARRMIPSWDEPAHKATFDVEATVPSRDMVISNMPESERADLGGGRTRVRFARTPRMSTYLLFLAVGDLERITTKAGKTEIGIVTQKGLGDQGRFALDSSATILQEYNDYFGAPYPLPKLDNVAAPGRSQFFGAMENWGAIFSFEYILLVDPSISTEADRQAIFSVAAHEISHQWFGDLVTMAWWDDLWLNEGFASWMAGRTTEKLHPEWNTALGKVRSRDQAMARDALATTHPVVQHIETVEQAAQAFDAITYQKGQAVITMLEGYTGEQAWRAGVRRYMERHAYANTVSDDLWREIEAAAGRPITAIAHDFTLQPGVPLITVGPSSCNGGTSRLTLTQGEFTRDRPGKKPLAWRVPVILQPVGAAEPVRTLVTGGQAVATVAGCEPVVVNAGQSGYYRTLYSPPQFARIVTRFAAVPALDQMGILTDTWALGRVGLQPASDVLELAAATPASADPQVWGQIADTFAGIDEIARGDARRTAFRKFAIARLSPVFATVGWNARPGESAPVAILRDTLIKTLGILGDPAVVAEARRRYAAQSSDPDAIPGALRKTITGVVARHADAATWEGVRAAALAEKTPLIKDHLYALLASTEDEALARRALDLALTAEPGATNSAEMVSKVGFEHPDLAFDFALSHFAALNDRLDATSRSRYYAGLAGRSGDQAMLGKLAAYAAAHVDEKSRRETDTAAANIADRIRVRGIVLPAVEAWLARGAGTSAAGVSSNDAPAYDAELTGYAYPYPVERFSFEAQGQQVSMAYMDVRPATPNGEAVVLLHGKNFSAAHWEKTIQALAARGYRVIAPDQIGFGKSTKPEHFQFSFHALAANTAALLDRLDLTRVAVVGHSMGGMLATRFALLYPERTRRLALVNPIGLEDWSRAVPYQPVDAWFAGEMRSTPERVREYMRENYFAGEWKPEYDALTRMQAGWLRGPDRRRIAWVSALLSDMITTQPVVHEFPDLRVPTLLVIGQRDRTALGKDRARPEMRAQLGNYPVLGRRAHERIPGARLVEIPEAGHLPQVEAFGRYIAALEGFLAG